MTAISVTDLNNAKTDVDHIAAVATSTAATATDRLGHTKPTIKGATDSITAKVAEVDARKDLAINTEIPAQVALVQSEIRGFIDGEIAIIGAAVWATEAAGRAAVADGVAFKVQGSGDVAAYEYRRTNSTTSVLIATYPSAYSTARLAEGAPAYTNTGGQANRTASVIAFVTASLLGGGTASNLVDGATGNNSTDSIAFNAVAVEGLVISFDFGAGAARVINEVTWKQGTTATHGTWKWQGSNDATTWTDIGSSFTLGGATAQVQTVLSANIVAYRHYRLLGVSGTASGAPYIQEVEFKISKSGVEGYARLTELNSGLASILSSTLDAAARLKLPANVVSYYPCDEGTGTSLRDIVGGNNATTSNGGGTVGWTREGWLQLTAGWFKTPAQATQTVVMLFRCPEGYTNYQFAAPDNNAVGQAYYGSSAATIRTLHGWGVSDVPRRTTGAGPTNLFAGGWCMVSLQIAVQTNNVTAIGAGNITGSGPVSAMEVAGIAILSGPATDAQLRQILNFAAEKNKPRGIYLTPWNCPRPAHLALVIGESTSEGTYPLSSLSAMQLAAMNEAVLIDARNSSSNATTGRIMKRLSLAATYANNNPPTTSTKSGLEVGLLNARINRSNDGRPLHILKAAQGSTWLVPSGSYANAAGGTTVVSSNATRNSGELEISGIAYLLEILNARRMENIARNQGVGYTSVSVIYSDGLNDAYIGTAAVPDAATYQGYLQARYDKLELMLGIINLKMICIKPHNPSGGIGGGDADYPNNATGTNRLAALGYIRTAFDSFKTANTADVSTLDGDSYALNTPTDYVHPSAAGYDAMGGAAEALFAYSTAVTPRA